MTTTTADTLAASADQAFADAQALADASLVASTAALAKADAAVAGLHESFPGYQGNPDDVIPAYISKPILPTTDFSTDVKQAFDYAFGSLNSVIQPQIFNYLEAFFPDISDTLKSGSDQWLIDTIQNGRYVPVSVETAIWNRAKDREAIEDTRAEQEIIDASASRGWSSPIGVLNYTVAVAQEELTKKAAGINREIAIKAFDTANENTKFAISEAVKLRTSFIAALGDFIKTAMAQPNSATEYARTILASKAQLYDNAIRLYSAQIDEEKMHTTTALENRNMDRHAFDSNLNSFTASMTNNHGVARIQSDVAMSAADQLGRTAAAAMATRNSVVSVSAGV